VSDTVIVIVGQSPEERARYAAAEAKAREAKLGLWLFLSRSHRGNGIETKLRRQR